MLTRNFNLFNSMLNRYGTSSSNYNYVIFLDTNGQETSQSTIDFIGYYAAHSVSIVLGGGDTEPTPEDYYVESEINTLTVISSGDDLPKNFSAQTIRYDTYSKFHFLTATVSVRNDTNAPITVREIAVCASNGSSSSSSTKKIMLSRNVISPVTIGVGEQKAFSVTIGDE